MNTSTGEEGGGGRKSRERGSITGGLVLIALGGLFLADKLLPEFRFSEYWPVILIAVGIGLLWKSRQA